MDTEPEWMWPAAVPPLPEESVGYLVRFRTEFELADRPDAAVRVKLSTDGRYRLLVNGELAATGPAKPSAFTRYVDEVDLGPLLTLGMNVVGVEVLLYPSDAGGNSSLIRDGVAGLSFEGGIAGVINFGRSDTWRCAHDPGRVFLQGDYTLFVGIQESADGRVAPNGWCRPGFDDREWMPPATTPSSRTRPGVLTLPSPLPPMTMRPTRFAGITRTRGVDPGWDGFLEAGSIVVPPNQLLDVDLDTGELLTAMVGLEVSAGAGAVVQLTAAECYERAPILAPWLRDKGLRTDSVHGDLYGDPDIYRVGGDGTPDDPERFDLFWFRTFRYLRLTVQTGNAPLVVSLPTIHETHYPLEVTGSFRSSAEVDGRLWETSQRTLLNCMHETFEDCPYYEQLQYAMDTRSEALFALHLSSDDRLIRRAIRDFAESGVPGGLTESRAPSVWPQIIPGFSLFWILMIGEHLQHVGDASFTRQFAARMREVLAVFDAALDEDGFVIAPASRPGTDSHAEVWNFVDWTDGWRATRGVPELGDRRASTILTFQYVAALQSASRTADACGDPLRAEEYARRATDVVQRISRSTAWDPHARYFRDSDAGIPASQHAQVWAVLAGAIQGDDAADLLARSTRDPDLAPCSYAMSHSLFDALRMAGVHDLVDWKPWTDMLDLGLTTWAEDTVSKRSDCHAWGSVPLQHFPRWVLGVSPARPGFATVRIDPAPSALDFAEGTVPTPLGPVNVRWDQHIPGVMSVTTTIPISMGVELPDVSADVTHSVDESVQTITFTHPVGRVRSTLAAEADRPVRQVSR